MNFVVKEYSNLASQLSMIKEWNEKLQSRLQNNVQDVAQLFSTAPKYTPKTHAQQYQMMAQQYVRNLPVEYQLEHLNKLQEKCPFLLTDPLLREIGGTGIPTYGFGDLYNFLGLSFGNIKLAKVPSNTKHYKAKLPPPMDPNNPNTLTENVFYAPVNYNYQIPNANTNMKLWDLYQQNPYSLMNILNNRANQILKMQGGSSSMSESDRKFYIDVTKDDINKLLDELIKRETDPYYLTKNVLGSQHDRPMSSYFRNNFDVLLHQLMLSHRIYKINDYKPNKDITISSKMHENYKKAKEYYKKN